jgi:hypothetical protein
MGTTTESNKYHFRNHSEQSAEPFGVIKAFETGGPLPGPLPNGPKIFVAGGVTGGGIVFVVNTYSLFCITMTI